MIKKVDSVEFIYKGVAEIDEIRNIKAILFDLDNTIMDFKECEKQSLEYLFKKMGEKFKK